MGLVAWIVVGAIAGFLANQVMGSREGLVMMVVLGIVGGLVGGFVATSVLKIGAVDGIDLESIAIATVGAIAVVFVANAARSGGLLAGRASLSPSGPCGPRPVARQSRRIWRMPPACVHSVGDQPCS